MVTPPRLRWYVAYGALTAAAVLLAPQAAKALRRYSQAAALACDWALGLLLAAAGCAVLGFVRQAVPAVTADAPWTPAAATLGSLSATALLVGAALAAAAAAAGGRAAAAAGTAAVRRAPAGEPGEEPA